MRELRRDPITQRWVLICTDYAKETPKDLCPFCPGNEALTPPDIYAIRGGGADGSSWWTRVVPNKYPFFKIEEPLNPHAEGIYDVMEGVGAHEIVIESPHHDHWGDMGEGQIERILRTYRQRIQDLRGDRRFRTIQIVKNYKFTPGEVRHPHSHILALPFTPFRTDEEIKGTRDYFMRKERCLFCDIISEETREGTRIIDENEDFLAFAPFASRYSFETCVIPRAHQPDFARADLDLGALAGMLRRFFARLRTVLQDPPYSMVIHTSPNPPRFEERYHWHIEIRPRIHEGMGFEWGTGFLVTYVAPEEAAAVLREKREDRP